MNLLALTKLIQTSLVLQDLVSSGLPFSKPNYDGADNYLLSQSDDPLMKVNCSSTLVERLKKELQQQETENYAKTGLLTSCMATYELP